MTISASLAARAAVVDLAALVIAALVVHATLAAAGATGTLPTIARKVAGPLAWPAAHLPGARGHPVVADLVTVVLTLLLSAAVVGVIAGYAAEARRHQEERQGRV